MTKTLLKYLSKLTVVILVTNVAFAQVESGKSRLDIGKKPTTKVTVPASLQRFSLLKSTPKELSLNKSFVVNQYFRNSLLNGSKSKTSNTETINKNTESNSNVETLQSSDKLYASERITVSNIYPNPANDFASVDYTISGNVNVANLTFFNVVGSEVGSFELDKFDRKLKVQTSDWEAGMYFYQLNVDGKKLITKKLLVRHN
jgi:Secretion system C-terminal sorting domain